MTFSTIQTTTGRAIIGESAAKRTAAPPKEITTRGTICIAIIIERCTAPVTCPMRLAT
jgi:hypothetical protein